MTHQKSQNFTSDERKSILCNAYGHLGNELGGDVDTNVRGLTDELIWDYVMSVYDPHEPSKGLVDPDELELRQFVLRELPIRIEHGLLPNNWPQRLSEYAEHDLERGFALLCKIGEIQPIPLGVKKAFTTLLRKVALSRARRSLRIEVELVPQTSSLPTTLRFVPHYTYLDGRTCAHSKSDFDVGFDEYGEYVHGLATWKSENGTTAWSELERPIRRLYSDVLSHLFGANMSRLLGELASDPLAFGKVIMEVREARNEAEMDGRAHLLNMPLELLCGPCEHIRLRLETLRQIRKVQGLAELILDLARLREAETWSDPDLRGIKKVCEDCQARRPQRCIGELLSRNDLSFFKRVRGKTNCEGSPCGLFKGKTTKIHIVALPPGNSDEREILGYVKMLDESVSRAAKDWGMGNNLAMIRHEFTGTADEIGGFLSQIMLEDEAAHVLHIIAHGELDEETGWKATLHGQQICPTEISNAIAIIKERELNLPMVCLQTCYSATCLPAQKLMVQSAVADREHDQGSAAPLRSHGGSSVATQPLSETYVETTLRQASGLMETLTERDIPVMIGFHGEFSAESATKLFQRFYIELLKWDYDVPLALHFARRQLQTAPGTREDTIWLAPVLLYQDFSDEETCHEVQSKRHVSSQP